MQTPRAAPSAPELTSRRFEDVAVGEDLPPVAFPLTVYRLVMWAGAGRDFNSIHHNTEYARGTGAAEMYANNSFLQGMWERTARDWAGPRAVIRNLRGFRMRRFNYVGSTPTVHGTVVELDPAEACVTVRLETRDAEGVTVGPGSMRLALPRRTD